MLRGHARSSVGQMAWKHRSHTWGLLSCGTDETFWTPGTTNTTADNSGGQELQTPSSTVSSGRKRVGGRTPHVPNAPRQRTTRVQHRGRQPFFPYKGLSTFIGPELSVRIKSGSICCSIAGQGETNLCILLRMRAYGTRSRPTSTRSRL
jgi:hypothetical protein